MVENILIFMRNCVMAVLTAWAGIQIAEDVAAKQSASQQPVVATSTVAPMKTGNGSPCPNGLTPANNPSSSAASAGSEPVTPRAQPSVLTIR